MRRFRLWQWRVPLAVLLLLLTLLFVITFHTPAGNSEVWRAQCHSKTRIGDTERTKTLPLPGTEALNISLENATFSFTPTTTATAVSYTTVSGGSSGNCSEPNDQDLAPLAHDILTQLKTSPRHKCNCSQLHRYPQNMQSLDSTITAESTCSAEATLLGPNQKVISFSFFKPKISQTSENVTSNFYMDIYENFKLMKTLYPGWVMRLYSDVPLEGGMCRVVCYSADIYYCDASRLPLLGDVRHVNPRSWRFLLLGDGTAAKFAVRDLDSRLSRRERDAVGVWENSNFALHGMRDHKMHSALIMAGMWGGDNYKLCHTTGQKIREEILNHSWNQTHTYDDQKLLGRVIYRKYKHQILIHDSYLCELFSDSVPFPTQRANDHDFIGAYSYVHYKALKNPCPLQCRPLYGLNWKYC